MGLSGLSCGVGGGTDETDDQTLTYSVDGLPEAAIGTVFWLMVKPQLLQERSSTRATARPAIPRNTKCFWTS